MIEARTDRLKRRSITDEILREIEPSVSDALNKSYPEAVFTDVWMKTRTSWCGSDMVDVWAVYEGDFKDLGPPAKPGLATLIQEILWDRETDASPSTHLVAKTEAGNLTAKTI